MGLTVILAIIFFSCPCRLFAETIVLKSGKRIEAKIVEKTGDYIKVDLGSAALYYNYQYIKSIEEDKPAVQSNPQGSPGLLSRPSKGPTSTVAIEGGASAVEVNAGLKKGLKYASEAKFKEAKEEFNRALAANNSDSNLLGALGIIADLESAKMNPEFAAKLFQGFYYLANEDYQQAIISLKEASQLEPEDADVYYNLGVAYYSLSDYQQAIVYLNKGLQLQPQDAQAHRLLGNAYYFTGQHENARQNYTAACDLFQKSGDKASAHQMHKLINTL